jgi:hypothetical protein
LQCLRTVPATSLWRATYTLEHCTVSTVDCERRAPYRTERPWSLIGMYVPNGHFDGTVWLITDVQCVSILRICGALPPRLICRDVTAFLCVVFNVSNV